MTLINHISSLGLIALAIFFYSASPAQDLTGQWEGILQQDGREDQFFYLLRISQDGKSISGNSFSRAESTNSEAYFSISGVWNGKELILQEIEQTKPKEPRWCLKYATLRLSDEGGVPKLEGKWKASGCTPGTLVLRKKEPGQDHFVEEEQPFTTAGKWTGHLAQSDREYGFFFEMVLDETKSGKSYIVSEDNGGSAFHNLEWTFMELGEDRYFQFVESEVAERTDEKWKWCIKSGELQLRREAHQYVLEGSWKGYIEGFDMESGPCASGTVYLEKPILTQKIKQEAAKEFDPYQHESKRSVKVSRVIEVQNATIRVRVWDNGTVDGDVVTLFLNGDQLLENYRVSKRKWSKPIKLNQENNFLILHAEDLGDISPNTVAVSIDDGVEDHIIILSSNLRESGAILIKQFNLN